MSFFTIITSANIQQLRWFQKKFYLITKNKEMIDKINYKYIEV